MKNLTLEISLKPFWGLDDAETAALCAFALRQWQALTDRTEQISVLLWAADGSEILDYGGDPDATFEWARYIGNANSHLYPALPADPDRKSLHASPHLYRADAGLLTYRRLARIVAAWRECVAALGKRVRVGLPFDPGGEFAPSTFKYKRHPEINLADTMGKGSFTCCYGVLDADDHTYAGWPRGIPQGTSLGSFLGRQFQCLARDVGLDFIWFSNGFGYGMETWKTRGPLFDGERFEPGHAPEVRDRILAFWRDFRTECPHLGIETRGTNLGTATDLASDATPLRELYEGGFDFAPPPNSPWAAINGDFGIELAGYLTRIAELPPGAVIPFRFYLHDPWWLNSPWLDRYERQPHDIYLPLSVSRIHSDATVRAAETLALLTIDNSLGELPGEVPVEASPHLLRAWERRPDAAGPLIWLYPFDELHDAMFQEPRQPERLFHTDWFLREIINDGVPVNTVLSTRAFAALDAKARASLRDHTLFSPTPLVESHERSLLDWAEAGGRLLLYGSLTASPHIRERLGLDPAPALDGRMEVQGELPDLDSYTSESCPAEFVHDAVLDGGALTEYPGESTSLIAVQGEERRALDAHFSTPAGGIVRWLRAPLALSLAAKAHLPERGNPLTTFPFGELVRREIAEFGWRIAFRAEDRSHRHPVLTLHRNANAWIFSGYTPDTTVDVLLRSPFGAPLFIGEETWIRDGASTHRPPRAWQSECRVFVEQSDGWLQHKEFIVGEPDVSRRLWVHGLRDARLSIFPPPEAKTLRVLVNPQWPHVQGDEAELLWEDTCQGRLVHNSEPITGSALISW